MKKLLALICFCTIITSVGAGATVRTDVPAPPELAKWHDWVLLGYETQAYCLEGQCLLPISLELALTDSGGSFIYKFENLNEGQVPLPGAEEAWPKKVQSEDGTDVLVFGREQPTAFLKPGRYSLKGEFSWTKLPETLNVPAGLLLKLSVNGKDIEFPGVDLDYNNRTANLWLKNKTARPQHEIVGGDPGTTEKQLEKDSQQVTISRLLQDSQPMIVTSRIKLVVSGQPREIFLDQLLLPGTEATSLQTPLSAQLAGRGLRLQAAPGVYEIYLTARAVNEVNQLGPHSALYGPEVWAFAPETNLRMVKIGGASQIDASLADIPSDWSGYELYLLEPEEKLIFETIRRGDGEPGPDALYLQRQCWLDYDGSGLSCLDQVSGEMKRQWHLNVDKPFELGHVSLDGQPQLITWQKNSQGGDDPGFQVREGRINFNADLRIDDFQNQIPASGWDHKLKTDRQLLNLPPGYKILAASGAKVYTPNGNPGTWWDRWGTLDFFIVLIITVAVFKLYGLKWSILALLALGLSFHEFMSPKIVFLHILICVALLRLLPKSGKARFVVNLWRYGAILVLLLLSSIFVITQVRGALYPQLESPYWDDMGKYIPTMASAAPEARPTQSAPVDYYDEEAMTGRMMKEDGSRDRSMAKMDMPLEAEDAMMAPPSPEPIKKQKLTESVGDSFDNLMRAQKPAAQLQKASDAIVQNGPGRPNWKWRQVYLDLNGEAAQEQQINLYFINPLASRILSVVRIILMLWFVLVNLEVGRFMKDRKIGRLFPRLTSLALGFLMIAGAATTAQAQENPSFPSSQLLSEYRNFLLQTKEVPSPVITSLDLNLTETEMSIGLTVNTAEKSLVTLPAVDQLIFYPKALTLDEGQNLPVLQDGYSYRALVPPGQHKLVLSGRLKKADAFQLSFQDNQRPKEINIIKAQGWEVHGLDGNGVVPTALYLQKIQSDAPIETPAAPDEKVQPEEEPQELNIDPFFMVERHLSLGLEWQVYTAIRRFTPTGGPASVKIPLLAGEKILTPGLSSQNGEVTINLASNEESVVFESSLPTGSEINLKAQKGPFSEAWVLDSSPIWRLELSGIAPIHRLSGGFWQPTFRPWAGEELRIKASRPEAVPGQYLSIDEARLSINVGELNRRYNLSIDLRSSKGGPWHFNLPPGAQLESLMLNGQSLPTANANTKADDKKGPQVSVPLSPGSHVINCEWMEDAPISFKVQSPDLKLGAKVANFHLSIEMPKDRWLLWAQGPLQGPAVLFWSFVGAVLIAAFILSKIKITPLGLISWFLLFLGLAQSSVLLAMVVVAWIMALALRQKYPPIENAHLFNLVQIFLLILTFSALWIIYKSIENGLLYLPDMYVSGNGSSQFYLAWFADQVQDLWPTGTVISLSDKIYKALILIWALWLALALIKWLRWGWSSFSHEVVWKHFKKRIQTPGV